MRPLWRVVGLLLLVVCVLGVGGKKEIWARKEDVKFIKCGVCREMVDELHSRGMTGGKKTEFQLIELAENVCNLKKDEGSWMMHLDLVEQGTKLQVVRQEMEGECGVECKTIERACQEVMGEHDTDVAESMFKKQKQQQQQGSKEWLHELVCKKLSGVCNRPPPALPQGRAPGPPFVAKTSKDAEIQRLMRSMGDMPGAGNMKMFSRDDLQNMKGFGSGAEDEEDDEDEVEEEGDGYGPRLAKVAAKGAGGGWLEKIRAGGVNGINMARVGLREVFDAASKQVGKWGASVKCALQGLGRRADAEL